MNRQTSTVRNHRILIVDDDDVLRRWLRAQLEPRAFEVWEESQGDEALAAYQHNLACEFVLSDMYFFRGENIKNGLDLVREIGWHTFRRTYTTLLHASGEDVKVVQELLWHGPARITMDVYSQAVTPAKRPGPGKSGRNAAGHRQEDRLKVVCPGCVPGGKGGFQQVFYFVGVPDGI